MTKGTLGVDLAAQKRKTAGCMIEWDDRGDGFVHCPTHDYRDEDLFAKLIDTDYVTRAAPLCQRPARRSPSRNQ
jgi:hypothetical protein